MLATRTERQEPSQTWYRHQRARTSSSFASGEVGPQKITSIAESPQFLATATLEEVYRAPEAVSPELRTAMVLLREVLESTEAALRLQAEGQVIAADDEMHHVQMTLPELFCCRALGDGFGAIVSALQSSFENLHGRPMTTQQVASVARAIGCLNIAPALPFESAIEQIEELERSGLAVDPEAVDFIAEWLIEQSVPGHDDSH